MTLQEFNELNGGQKTATIYDQGAYIGERSEEYYNILLYKLPGFYVELFYHEQGNEIAHINGFSEETTSSLLYSHLSSLN